MYRSVISSCLYIFLPSRKYYRTPGQGFVYVLWATDRNEACGPMLNWWLPTQINQFTSLPLSFLSPNMHGTACPLGHSFDKYLSRSYAVCLASAKVLELQRWTNYMRFMSLWNWNTSGSESCRGKSYRSKAIYVSCLWRLPFPLCLWNQWSCMIPLCIGTYSRTPG